MFIFLSLTPFWMKSIRKTGLNLPVCLLDFPASVTMRTFKKSVQERGYKDRRDFFAKNLDKNKHQMADMVDMSVATIRKHINKVTESLPQDSKFRRKLDGKIQSQKSEFIERIEEMGYDSRPDFFADHWEKKHSEIAEMVGMSKEVVSYHQMKAVEEVENMSSDDMMKSLPF